jgi:hypothetical protein
MDPTLAATADTPVLERARKLANFFAQPFFCAEPWTKRPGSHVSLADALRTCAEILEGIYDDYLPVALTKARGTPNPTNSLLSHALIRLREAGLAQHDENCRTKAISPETRADRFCHDDPASHSA